MKGNASVEEALEGYYDLSESDDDDDDKDGDDKDGDDLANVGIQHMRTIVDDHDAPMGASQSADHMLPAGQGRKPRTKCPPKPALVPSLLPHPASLNIGSASQHRLSQPQQLSHEQLSLSRQSSGGSNGSLGRAGSLAGAGLSRLGALGQGRASGSSQQASHRTNFQQACD